MNQYIYAKFSIKHHGCWSAFSTYSYFDTLINIDYSTFDVLKAHRLAIIRGSKDGGKAQVKSMLNNDKSIIDYEISEIFAKNRYSIYIISMLQAIESTVISKLKMQDIILLNTNIYDGKELYEIIGTKTSKTVITNKLSDNRIQILDLVYEYVDEEKIIKILSRNIVNMLLTEKEQLILRKAKELGYLDIPRRKNLEEVAKELGTSKMNLSLSLRKILKKFSSLA
ncbi:bacterio-opsin activator [Sulfolobus sp. S-194]|uniref:helix-turn-helix domain-containing protein n=1 Tax=Sulfolobus sp. S-194 TaxID=2512240 RepID=UPI001436DB67|nr:helix-turn-helix domain-containing protein [Sulfolobus sp. S-194]QIW23831.1 bacterio-opsin activator [Sulfolobus sp. S-194]